MANEKNFLHTRLKSYLNKRPDGLLQHENGKDHDTLQCVDDVKHRPHGHCAGARARRPGDHLQHPRQPHDDGEQAACTETDGRKCFYVISIIPENCFRILACRTKISQLIKYLMQTLSRCLMSIMFLEESKRNNKSVFCLFFAMRSMSSSRVKL